MKYKVILPILGFEDIKEFELEKIDDNFYTLKSDNVTFTLINPFFIRDDYDFEINDHDQKALQLDENTNFTVLNLMIVNKPFLDSTVNFAAPLIFNNDKKLLGQVVLDSYGYGLTEPLKNFVKAKD
jgi:flagellar assembly factor FliW